MPASNYVVASAAQLGGSTKPPRTVRSRAKHDRIPVKEATQSLSTRDPSREQCAVESLTQPVKAIVERNPLIETTYSSRSTSSTSTSLANKSTTTAPSSTSNNGCHATDKCSLYPEALSYGNIHKPEPLSDIVRRQMTEQLTVTIDQLNQVVSALVHAPLVTSSLQNRHLTFTASSQAGGIYNLSNNQFVTRMAQEFAPDLHLLNGRSGGASMIDTETADGAVLYTSAIRDSCSLKSGDRAQIALPAELPTAVRLTYLPPTEDGMLSKVTLQSVHAVYARKSDNLTHHLSVEEDLTDAFKKAALAEIARTRNIHVENIKIVEDVTTAFNKNSVDWSAVADALLASGESIDIVDQTLEEIRSLDATTCAMQTLTLLADVSRLKSCNRDFLVLKLVRDTASEKVEKTTVPHWSQSLWSLFNAKKGRVDALKLAQDFIHSVVKAVYPCPYMTEEFAISDMSGLNKLFRCLPLYDHGTQTPTAWAVFIEPGVKAALISKAQQQQSVM